MVRSRVQQARSLWGVRNFGLAVAEAKYIVVGTLCVKAAADLYPDNVAVFFNGGWKLFLRG